MRRLHLTATLILCALTVCSCHEEESRLVIIAPDETEYWKCCEYFPDIECICTGIGAGNIIKACSELPKGTRIINIGYAGSNNLDIGDVRLVSDSYRYMEGQVVFTDYANPYHLSDEGIPCYTGNSFVTESDMTEPTLFDMELNYIAAFTPGLELVGSIKIVSNNLCMEEYLINTLLESDILTSDEVWSKVRDLVDRLCNSQTSVPASYSRIVGEVTGDASYDADTLSAGGLALRVAMSMIGTKYVAGTLEREPERLRVSLDSTDCMLFVELCCGFALTLQSGEPSYTLLEDNIRQMRYRNGIIDGYTSRIHYFSEWIAQNVSRGVMNEVTESLGGVPLEQSFGFMSGNPELYAQLKDNPSAVKAIAAIEDSLSACRYFYIPQKSIPAADIREGDIICFVSTREGLDISHVAFACQVDGEMHFIHASSQYGEVVIDAKTIGEYAKNGIRVVRL